MNFSIFQNLKELINSKCLAILKLGVSSKDSLDYSMIHCITDRLRRHMRVLMKENVYLKIIIFQAPIYTLIIVWLKKDLMSSEKLNSKGLHSILIFTKSNMPTPFFDLNHKLIFLCSTTISESNRLTALQY